MATTDVRVGGTGSLGHVFSYGLSHPIKTLPPFLSRQHVPLCVIVFSRISALINLPSGTPECLFPVGFPRRRVFVKTGECQEAFHG